MTEFQKELQSLLNQHCAENGSDTPDFILAAYLLDCLAAFDRATRTRDEWRKPALQPFPVSISPAKTGSPIESKIVYTDFPSNFEIGNIHPKGIYD